MRYNIAVIPGDGIGLEVDSVKPMRVLREPRLKGTEISTLAFQRAITWPEAVQSMKKCVYRFRKKR